MFVDMLFSQAGPGPVGLVHSGLPPRVSYISATLTLEALLLKVLNLIELMTEELKACFRSSLGTVGN